MRTVLTFTYAVLLFLCYFGSANALTFSVNDNLADNLYMEGGSKISGHFDINPFIPNNGQYTKTYDIVSASFTFYFTDDLDVNFTNPDSIDESRNYNYMDGFFHPMRDVQKRDYYYYYHDSEEEFAAVLFESMDVWHTRDQNKYLSSRREILKKGLTPLYHIPNYQSATLFHNGDDLYLDSSVTGCSGPICGSAQKYTEKFHMVEGYFNDQIIQDDAKGMMPYLLGADGILNFGIWAYSGDIVLSYARLDVELNENPISSVPLPGTFFLLCTGLVGLGAVGRK